MSDSERTTDVSKASSPATLVIELRQQIEQIVNSTAAGITHADMPKSLGILIPSLDLQRNIDDILTAFATTLAALQSQMPEKRATPEGINAYGNKGFNKALDQTQAPLTALIEELRGE